MALTLDVHHILRAMSEKSAHKALPVYCIATFKDQNTRTFNFDIKALENLVDRFEFTNLAHRHDFYDILFITEGSGTHTIDFVTYEVKPGSIFFLSPGQVHSWDLSHDTRGFTIFFRPEYYLMDVHKKGLQEFPFFHSMQVSPAIYLDCENHRFAEGIITDIFQEYKGNHFGKDEVIRAYLDILFIKISRFCRVERDFPQNVLTGKLRELERLIERHFAEEKQPSFYATRMNVSLSYLNKLTKESLNKSVGRMVQERIVLESKRLLLLSGLTVAEVAHALGYQDNSYFTRFFKSKVGVGPEQFRKSNVPQ